MTTPSLPSTAALLGAAILAAGCTAADAPGSASAAQARQCFRADDVRSFSPTRDDAVIVRARASDYYRLELTGPCPDIDWTLNVALLSRGGSWVCRGYDAELIVPGPLGAQTCPVRAIRQLSEAEIRAFHAERR